MDTDDQSLAALGVESNFERSMSTLENFALGFTYLSPVVGAYSLFDISLHLGGAPMIWSYLVVGVGQFLVALVFGEIVSQFPISGGLYPWSRRLVGRKWAWMSAWIYVWALFITVAATATGAAPFLTLLTGTSGNATFGTVVAFLLIVISTIVNLAGTRLLARIAMFGFVCELVGALAVGGYLLLFHRVQPLHVVFDPMNAIGSSGSYLPAFLAASILGLFSCYGFEACADVAEEIAEPGIRIPKAMRLTIYVGVGASILAALAITLSVRDIHAVIAGTATHPLADVLLANFGPWGARGVAAVVMVSFVSCVLSLQAAVSRLIYSFARDGMVPGSSALAKLSRHHVPKNALYLSGVVPAAIALVGLVLPNALTLIVSFAVVGIYTAFQMVVAASLYARAKGWGPSGPFRLGAWAWPVNIGAQVYGLAAIANMVWPRGGTGVWYIDNSAALGLAVVIGVALAYMMVARPYARGSAPYGDAWTLFPRSG